MFRFYAINPTDLSKDVKTTNMISILFGFSKGRIIEVLSRNYWHIFNESLKANNALSIIQKKKIVEKAKNLNQKAAIAKKPGRRPYDNTISYLDNVKLTNKEIEFDGILSEDELDLPNWLSIEDLDEESEQLVIKWDDKISREVTALSNAVGSVFFTGKHIKIQDYYFDPLADRFAKSFGAYISKIKEANHKEVTIEYHLVDKNKFGLEKFAEHCSSSLTKYLHDEYSVKFFHWESFENRQRVHARQIMTERAGIRIDSGTDTIKNYQEDVTYVNIISTENVREARADFSEESKVYKLNGIIVLNPSGETKIIEKNKKH